MQARIQKWKELSQGRNIGLQQIEKFKQESLEREAKKHKDSLMAEAVLKLPLRYQYKNWSDFKTDWPGQAKALNIMQQYAKTFPDRLKDGNNIIFLGKPGTGKTLLALILCQSLIKVGEQTAYEPSLSFLRGLQEKRFSAPASCSSVLEHYKNVHFLIIDEVTEGSGKNGSLTGWENELLFKIIDSRYQQKRCTLIISNRTRPELMSSLGAPMLDRFADKGIALAFNWESYRK